MYHRILIATDGSELAQKGLEQGLALAKQLGAEVTIVTVTEPTLPVAAAAQSTWVPAFDATALDEAKTASAKDILDEASARAESAGLRADVVHIANHYPAEGIVKAAEERHSDLIVISSHGRRGIGRLLLGSQTTEVLTHSKIPVLVVK